MNDQAALDDWHKLLQKHEAPIRNLVIELRSASSRGILCLLTRDKEILKLKEPLIVAWVFLLTIRAPICRGHVAHPWLARFVAEAMKTGESEGWEDRGFVVCSARLIEAVMLLEKLLLTLFEMQASGVMSDAENWWVRELLMRVF